MMTEAPPPESCILLDAPQRAPPGQSQPIPLVFKVIIRGVESFEGQSLWVSTSSETTVDEAMRAVAVRVGMRGVAYRRHKMRTSSGNIQIDYSMTMAAFLNTCRTQDVPFSLTFRPQK